MSDRREVTRLVGDRGEFTLTARMLTESDARTVSDFEKALVAEADARGLAVYVEKDIPAGSVRVRWRPAETHPPGNE